MPLVATYSVTHLQPHVAITETQKRTVGDSAHPGAVARAAVHPSTSKARPHFAGLHILYPSQTSQLEKWSFECGALIHAARRTKQQQLASSSVSPTLPAVGRQTSTRFLCLSAASSAIHPTDVFTTPYAYRPRTSAVRWCVCDQRTETRGASRSCV